MNDVSDGRLQHNDVVEMSFTILNISGKSFAVATLCYVLYGSVRTTVYLEWFSLN